MNKLEKIQSRINLLNQKYIVGLDEDDYVVATKCSSYKEEESIPKGVEVLGSSLYNMNHFLRSIEIPESVIAFRNYVFSNCSNLKEIKMPDSVLEIGNGCFECSGLEHIELSKSMYNLPRNTFKHCFYLKELDLSRTRIEYIGKHAIMFSGIEYLALPETLKKFDFSGLANNIHLKTIVCPTLNFVKSKEDFKSFIEEVDGIPDIVEIYVPREYIRKLQKYANRVKIREYESKVA